MEEWLRKFDESVTGPVGDWLESVGVGRLGGAVIGGGLLLVLLITESLNLGVLSFSANPPFLNWEIWQKNALWAKTWMKILLPKLENSLIKAIWRLQ